VKLTDKTPRWLDNTSGAIIIGLAVGVLSLGGVSIFTLCALNSKADGLFTIFGQLIGTFGLWRFVLDIYRANDDNKQCIWEKHNDTLMGEVVCASTMTLPLFVSLGCLAAGFVL